MTDSDVVPMKKLETTVSSAIRRGQIITRLSDVVRELVDNAIDAGPTRIQVLLDNFGLDKIEVRDDGHGITPSQIRSAVAGGYTSKLTSDENLSCGEHYGFRGEALSSICSFASVIILTRAEKDPHATRYILDEAGNIKGENKAALARGTNVIVRDLFAKYPVRRNFIREKSRTTTELKEIEFYLKSVALANHKISILLLHNGSAIWTKPSVLSLDQAICSVLGVGVAKQLSKCGPVEITTPGSSNRNDLVTEIELHLPKSPIDTKLMTTSSNKSIVIIINRRRVQLRELERMLHKYIMGAIPSATQTTQTKHPVTVLKITTPSEQADFNRDMNKSKIFLMHQTEISEKIEEMLKDFYPVDGNLNSSKENVPGAANVSLNTPTTAPPLAFDPPSSTVKAPADFRSQNIMSFLNEIPASSRENFSKSPVKTPTFPRANICLSPSSTAPEELLRAGFPPKSNTNERPYSNDSAPKNPAAALDFDRDWILGRLRDQHGNIIENTTVVRGTAGIGGLVESITTPRQRRHSAELPHPPRIRVPVTPIIEAPPILNSSVTSPTMFPPRDERDKTEEFFARLRNCHNLSTGSSASSVHEYPRYDPPPPKRSRSRANSISSQSITLDEERFQRRSSQSQTPRAPRQVTLDSLRNWKLPGSTFSRTNSIQSTPTPLRVNNVQQMSTPTTMPRRNSSCELFGSTSRSSPFPQVDRDREVQIIHPPVMMQPSVKSAFSKTSALPVPAAKYPVLDEILPTLTRSVSVSSMFKPKDSPETQPEERIAANKVIGVLPGTKYYVVQLEHLMGVFSPWNLLEMVPTLKPKFGIQMHSKEKNLVLSYENVKLLADEFTELSYDDYTEEAVSKIFTVLKDFEEEPAEM